MFGPHIVTLLHECSWCFWQFSYTKVLTYMLNSHTTVGSILNFRHSWPQCDSRGLTDPFWGFVCMFSFPKPRETHFRKCNASKQVLWPDVIQNVDSINPKTQIIVGQWPILSAINPTRYEVSSLAFNIWSNRVIFVLSKTFLQYFQGQGWAEVVMRPGFGMELSNAILRHVEINTPPVWLLHQTLETVWIAVYSR